MPYAEDNSFGICLGCGCHVLHSKQYANCAEKFTYNLRTFISQHRLWYPILYGEITGDNVAMQVAAFFNVGIVCVRIEVQSVISTNSMFPRFAGGNAPTTYMGKSLRCIDGENTFKCRLRLGKLQLDGHVTQLLTASQT